MLELFNEGGNYTTDRIVFECVPDSINAVEDKVEFISCEKNSVLLRVNRRVIQEKYLIDVTFSLTRTLTQQAAKFSTDKIEKEVLANKKEVVESFMPYVSAFVISLANTIGSLPLFMTSVELIEE